jgi:transcriptional regulator with XRE-family HTH domain
MESVIANKSQAGGQLVGERIRKLRLARGITIDALAKSAGITKGFLSKLETGKKTPAIATLGNIADALNVEASLLMKAEQSERLAPAEDTIAKVGERIRHVRLARGLTVEKLAQKSGITKGFLSKIERGEKAPAISTLINLAKSLNVEVSRLLESGEQERVSLLKRQDRVTLRYTSAFGYRYSPLAHAIDHKHMEPFIVSVPRNPRYVGPGLQHPGEEFMLVIRGKLLVWVADKEYVLEEGDAIYFDSSLPHWCKSLLKEDCEILDTSYVPFV